MKPSPNETELRFLTGSQVTGFAMQFNFPNSKSSGFGLSSDIYLLV
jgi:hypothetical protein